jgi:eukaryotic-like serine/threonine-protein kinase
MSLIGKSIGNYQIKAKLGEGGMGTVYLGEHPLIGKRVAVKVLLEELSANQQIVDRFFNEAKAVNAIGHQNIVDVVDFGTIKSDTGLDIVYFIMEYLDGESLASRIKRQGLTLQETSHVIGQSCSALAASHAKGIVHRDLKPDNIYLCPRGGDRNFVKILDFGIAKLTGDGPGGSMKTRTGLVIGTPAYMSPEQCEGKGLIDHRSDIYSLGVLMYELLTGRVPFPGEGFGEVLVAHLTKTPDPPTSLNPDITAEMEAIVLHAIEKDRNRRFQSMQEMEQALLNQQDHLARYKQLPGYTAPSASTSNHGTMVLGAEQPTVRGPSSIMPQVKGPVTNAGTRVTTLSGASGEVTNVGRVGRGRAPMVAVIAGVATLALAGGGFLLLRGKSPATPAATVQAPAGDPAAPKDEMLTITITSEPVGAHVIRADQGGADVGETPVDLKVKKGDPSFDVQIRLEGYQSQTRSVSTNNSKEMVVVMAKVQAPAPPPVAPLPPAPVAATPAVGKPAHPHVSQHHDAAGGKKKKDSVDSDGIMTPSF